MSEKGGSTPGLEGCRGEGGRGALLFVFWGRNVHQATARQEITLGKPKRTAGGKISRSLHKTLAMGP